MGEELECSVSLRDWVRVVEVGSVSLRFKGSPLGGEAGLFLKDGVFFQVNDLSLRDLDEGAPMYRLLGDFQLSSLGIDR